MEDNTTKSMELDDNSNDNVDTGEGGGVDDETRSKNP